MAFKKASEEEKEILEQYLLQFLNLEKMYPLLPGIQNTEAMAHLMGLEREELVTIRERMEENARQAAEELLTDKDVVEWLENIPFDPDDTIVAIGDSITDDLQGWFSILEHVLELAVPEANFKMINSGVSYDTSTDAIKRLNRDMMAHEPDWVIVALGTFDVQRLHIAPQRTLVSLADLWENLNLIESAIEEVTENPPVWITPPAVITQMMQKVELFNYTLEERDLAEVREVITSKKGYVVDPTGKRMGEDENGNPQAWNYLADGLHPNVSGHVNTVKALIYTLTHTEEKDGAEIETPDEFSDEEEI
jgi:lysophospholipase L1-like esterase